MYYNQDIRNIGNQSELEDLINNSTGVINLDKDYRLSGSSISIKFNNTIIDGYGHVIDGVSESNIFNIIASNVTIQNIIFINGNSEDGGSLYWSGRFGTLSNCSFLNNTANTGGGLYWTGEYGNLNNCIFLNNTANTGGGLYWTGKFGTLYDSLFLKNTAKNFGGGFYWNGDYGNTWDSIFLNNTANNGGGLYWNGIFADLIDCIFLNNTANTGGGLYWFSYYGNIQSDIFMNNSADYGGAAYCNGNSTSSYTLWESAFLNNTANFGGALYCSGNSSLLFKSVFLNNTANNLGGAIYYKTNESTDINSIFIDNYAVNGSGIYIDNVKLNLTNTSFIRNMANSTSLTVFHENNKYVATLTGGNNIINALYNNGSSDNIIINGIPVSNNISNNIYQSSLLYNQSINITLYDENNSVLDSIILNTDNKGEVEYNTTIGSRLIFNYTGNLYTSISNETILNKNNGTSMKVFVNNLMIYGDTNLVDGFLFNNSTNMSLQGHHVYINLTRLSTGASKIYTVTTDYEGYFQLPINLAANEYTVEFIYTGELGQESVKSDLYYFNVTLSTKTTLLTLDFEKSMNYSDDNFISGALSSQYALGLMNQRINLNLTRLSTGASKIYTVTTDFIGHFNLPLNLSPGDYTVQAIYNDQSGFKGSETNITKFTIKKNNEE